jgi:hypothetical protein
MSDKKEDSLQVRFFERIKEIIPVSLSLVNEVAEVLNMSSDSAYRRLRGETPLSIDEISLLCNHFKIGFDIFSEQAGTVSFNFDQMHGIKDFHNYLLDIRNTLVSLGKSENSELFYAAIDIPIVHHFNYHELSAFKMFYWLKDVLNEPSFDGLKFNVSSVSSELKELGKEIYNAYCKLSSTEVWSDATINGSIAQIEFYWDSGLIESRDLAILICTQLEEEIKTIQKQAELSGKILTDNTAMSENFKLYVSDIEIGNNCILTRKADIKQVYLSFHTFNKLATGNTKFCDDTFKWLNNLIRKSTLISGVSEKQRYIFFKQVFDKINRLKSKLENSANS